MSRGSSVQPVSLHQISNILLRQVLCFKYLLPSFVDISQLLFPCVMNSKQKEELEMPFLELFGCHEYN